MKIDKTDIISQIITETGVNEETANTLYNYIEDVIINNLARIEKKT